MSRIRVLVIGGYGFFGGRIAKMLARDPRFAVLVGGRRRDQCERFTQDLARRFTHAEVEPYAIDITRPKLRDKLGASGARLVIHASGPFQGQDYAVVEACIAGGIHYIDLADSRAFVAGIAALDAAARGANVLVASGASSVPGLSGAVIDRFAGDFRRLESIAIGISPGNRTDRGLATVAAILGYCGKPFEAWMNGGWKPVYGWQGLIRHPFPAPLGGRWLSYCDVPDLSLFPARYAGVETVAFRAGLELGVLHLGLWSLSWLARMGAVHDWARYARQLKWLSERLAGLGSDAGGMYVELQGQGANNRPLALTWTLIARDGDGPQVPCAASVLLAKKLAVGQFDGRGARPCLGLFTLAEFVDELRDSAIETRVERA